MFQLHLCGKKTELCSALGGCVSVAKHTFTERGHGQLSGKPLIAMKVVLCGEVMIHCDSCRKDTQTV